MSERQLDEVMVDFWENHFSVFSGKGQTRLFLASYDSDVIRPHALGKFRDLLGAVAKSPALPPSGSVIPRHCCAISHPGAPTTIGARSRR